jgi:hypothetical protein
MLTCVSSKTRSHDVLGAFGEAKMESSQGEAKGYLQCGTRAVSRKRGQNDVQKEPDRAMKRPAWFLVIGYWLWVTSAPRTWLSNP